jgi:hypothetical protein
LLLLDEVSMQAPLQACSPGPHWMPHLPALQLAEPPGVPGQTLPQAPQLLGSPSKLKQTPPQSL